MLKKILKTIYLRLLLHMPHDAIYAFHNVSSHPEVELTARKLDTEKFYDFVKRHGPYVSLREIEEGRLYARRAAITFDDGLEDVYTIAYPFLREQGIPFTAFVLTDKLDQPGYLTTSQLREMSFDPMVTIGSHGTDHSRFPQITEAELRHELQASKAKLEEVLGRPCDVVAYPFGAFDETTVRLAKEAGYTRAYAVKGRPLMKWQKRDPYGVPRLSIDDTTLVYYDH